MLILGIESSCDETAAAVVKGGREILSNVVVSQIDMHAVFGGVVPEIASRRHIEVISGITQKAMDDAGVWLPDLDAIAVTFAPGLIGALLVGLNFAKGLALAAKKPIVPVHHIRGHAAANYLAFGDFEPPFCCLVASGGHTLILGVDSYTDYRIIGSTRDDAAGEVFDKVARVLGIGYPGGRILDELAAGGDEHAFRLPRSKFDDAPYDMSFSGLKTAMINLIHNARQADGLQTESAKWQSDLAASFSLAVSDTVVPRVIAAAKEFGYKKISAAGGVAANSKIRRTLEQAARQNGIELFLPPLSLCGDNAAMIASQGYYEFLAGNVADMSLNAVATLGADLV